MMIWRRIPIRKSLLMALENGVCSFTFVGPKSVIQSGSIKQSCWIVNRANTYLGNRNVYEILFSIGDCGWGLKSPKFGCNRNLTAFPSGMLCCSFAQLCMERPSTIPSDDNRMDTALRLMNVLDKALSSGERGGGIQQSALYAIVSDTA